MNRRGLIIYRKNNEEKASKFIDEFLTRYELKKNTTFGSISSSGKDSKFKIFQVREEAFKSYSQFEDFLIGLAEYFDDIDELGLVIGHNDKNGFIWTDYHFDL